MLKYRPRSGSGRIPALRIDQFPAGKIRDLPEKHTFLEHFRWIIISSEYGVSKPDPRSFNSFLQWTRLEREECVFIGDLEANVSSAFRMGWKTIRFHSPERLAAELDKLGVMTGSLAEPRTRERD
jgi:FMN phosphatase YigB (HAD superfamily)